MPSCASFGGAFPSAETELLELPGIGPYTAAAIAAIAFGEKATPVDGNVERVVARLFAVRQPLPAAKSEIRRLAATLTPARRAGDFAQAMMDLGAEICTPKSPSCLVCPVQQDCAANARGHRRVAAMRLERNEAGTAVALRHRFLALARGRRVFCCASAPRRDCSAACWRCPRRLGAICCRRRRKRCVRRRSRRHWWPVPGTVMHVFTHFRLELIVYRALVPADATLTLMGRARALPLGDAARLHARPLPSVMSKVIAHGLDGNR